ncbi:MAG: T9SS type A sorting domain-containing protein [Bacteroidota bacterium]
MKVFYKHSIFIFTFLILAVINNLKAQETLDLTGDNLGDLSESGLNSFTAVIGFNMPPNDAIIVVNSDKGTEYSMNYSSAMWHEDLEDEIPQIIGLAAEGDKGAEGPGTLEFTINSGIASLAFQTYSEEHDDIDFVDPVVYINDVKVTDFEEINVEGEVNIKFVNEAETKNEDDDTDKYDLIVITSVSWTNYGLALDDYRLNPINFHPNPIGDNGILNFDNYSLTKIEIYNTEGRRIKTFENIKGNKINISELEKGIYFMIAEDVDNKKYSSKVIK